MPRKITLVACGLGPASLTLEAQAAIAEADLVFGAQRLLDAYAAGKEAYPYYKAEDIRRQLGETREVDDLGEGGKASKVGEPGEGGGPKVQPCPEHIAILISGDTGFYSAARQLTQAFADEDLTVLPGISSLVGFCAKLKRPWQDVAVKSLHGRTGSAVDTVRRHASSFFLLGPDKDLVLADLIDKGFADLTGYLGENLGLPDEHLQRGPLKDLQFSSEEALSVLLVDNPAYDPRVRSGIPDGEFIRGDVPMTKSAVRAWIMANLAIRPEEVCFDIGAGTGSCTVEMALAAYEGRVYAIEKDPEGLDLIRQNLRRFQLGNVEIVPGPAPEFLADLPRPDLAFIGGSGGKMAEIVTALLAKNPQVRLVITAIALETLAQTCQVFSDLGLAFEISQLAVSKGQKAGPYHLLKGENPTFVICTENCRL